MAGVLSVDIDVLTKAVQALNSAEQVLNDAMTAMSDDSNKDIGTAELNNAADSFQTRWKYGIERIGESAVVTAQGISKCLEAYQTTDTAFSKALADANSSLEGPTKA
ncbi:hypothetical protein [Nocardia caishijiensis]|uniref:Excreted virulence factor EspC (Type VII ESX diderm) n=1 Tax=Nocardia caishijiensis TaxID=184756 RepID=A0ABQ6YKS5_9NOCA|nr:hypothetical protein [Nocardia caishijiensis]KAF0846390.1 hypothetical protein FNL39_105301 [Nocardia caishijiensis]